MNKLVTTMVLACLCAGPLLADAPKTSSTDQHVADTLKQLAQDWGDAEKVLDTERLSQIVAPDWRALGTKGGVVTRERFLADVKSGRNKLVSFELGPQDVKMVSDEIAVVQGSVTETRMLDGKDRGGQFVFMDVFVKRGDAWVVVRSAGAQVK
jgi:hypothetical protein